MAVVQHIALLLKVIVLSTFKFVFCKQEVTPAPDPIKNPVVSRIEYTHQLRFSIGFSLALYTSNQHTLIA